MCAASLAAIHHLSLSATHVHRIYQIYWVSSKLSKTFPFQRQVVAGSPEVPPLLALVVGWLGPCCLELLRRRCWRGLRNLHSGGAASQDSVGSGGGPRSSTLHVPPSPHLTNPKTMRAVLVAVLGVAGQLSATPSPQSVNPSGPPTEHQPSTKVVENDRYYTLSVYQNNAGNSFEDNLINMDSAELKKGEKQLLSWFGLHFVQEMD